MAMVLTVFVSSPRAVQQLAFMWFVVLPLPVSFFAAVPTLAVPLVHFGFVTFNRCVSCTPINRAETLPLSTSALILVYCVLLSTCTSASCYMPYRSSFPKIAVLAVAIDARIVRRGCCMISCCSFLRMPAFLTSWLSLHAA